MVNGCPSPLLLGESASVRVQSRNSRKGTLGGRPGGDLAANTVGSKVLSGHSFEMRPFSLGHAGPNTVALRVLLVERQTLHVSISEGGARSRDRGRADSDRCSWQEFEWVDRERSVVSKPELLKLRKEQLAQRVGTGSAEKMREDRRRGDKEAYLAR